jgi:hypothetical protein
MEERSESPSGILLLSRQAVRVRGQGRFDISVTKAIANDVEGSMRSTEY